MNTSIIVGSIALVLAGVLATGHAFGQETSHGITAPSELQLDATSLPLPA